jgi:ribosomal protein S18 acetylase RimI-like enzyme
MAPDPAALPSADIRMLRPDDWAAVRAVRLTALAQAPDAYASTLDREQAFDEQIWRERLAETAYFGAWGAQPEPGLVGLVATFPEHPAEADGTARSALRMDSAAEGWHLVAMWVDPAYRGQGIADRLAEAVCRLARQRGAAQVALWVADANPRARAVYRRLGFRLTGERGLLRTPGPGEPELWEERMTLPLGGEPGS